MIVSLRIRIVSVISIRFVSISIIHIYILSIRIVSGSIIHVNLIRIRIVGVAVIHVSIISVVTFWTDFSACDANVSLAPWWRRGGAAGGWLPARQDGV